MELSHSRRRLHQFRGADRLRGLVVIEDKAMKQSVTWRGPPLSPASSSPHSTGSRPKKHLTAVRCRKLILLHALHNFKQWLFLRVSSHLCHMQDASHTSLHPTVEEACQPTVPKNLQVSPRSRRSRRSWSCRGHTHGRGCEQTQRDRASAFAVGRTTKLQSALDSCDRLPMCGQTHISFA